MRDKEKNQLDYSIVIPSRYHSQRLPAKALVDIAGKPMIQRVYEQALQTSAKEIIVATDDQRILTQVHSFGGKACLTSSTHQSGTERLAEVVRLNGWSDDHIVVNVQGDEPLIPPSIIEQVAKNLSENNTDKLHMATLAIPIVQEDLFNPNAVKVVRDKSGYALYFSRSTIPFYRDLFDTENTKKQKPLTDEQFKTLAIFRHVGLYAYRAGFIKHYLEMPLSPLETIESLEQLRVLWNGYKIHVDIAIETPEIGVDTEHDLERVREILAKRDNKK